MLDSSALLIAEEAVKYGTVNAPGWALPAGAIFVILLAAVPALLAPGEQVSLKYY